MIRSPLGLAVWLRKHLRYAEDEARFIEAVRAGKGEFGPESTWYDTTARRRRFKATIAHIPAIFRPPLRFGYILFWRREICDGSVGILYALMLSVYKGMMAIFLMPAQQNLWASLGSGKLPSVCYRAISAAL